mmetsp:Transcript_14066/g.41922  ORF Transcript_14066/g.41922 Transcript_14066/m.41922 type:complete len:269 (+) Transcript_14066:86-892(+)
MAEDLREEVRKRQRELESALEEKENETKRAKTVINGIADEFVCPITQELPVDPVTAEDGKVYERSAIEQWLTQKQTSPSTGAAMGPRLFDATQVKNTIEALVKSGAIDGDKATAWKAKLKDETLVKETRAQAEGGDGYAMWQLGTWYGTGKHGLAQDRVQARAWYERSAAARDPRGMGQFGGYLLEGRGGPVDTALGLVYASQSAMLGSDFGAYYLGKAFHLGRYGVRRDPAQARFWLRKIVSGECEFNHLNYKSVQRPARWLRELGG